MNINTKVQVYLDAARTALQLGSEQRHSALEAIPVPVYLTDPNGTLTYCNRACHDMAGREPQPGKDRWCVTWRLRSTSDEPLPHDRCPMALAIKEKREIRNEVAIALRPDGARKAFMPFPTPLFGDDGELVGAFNILVDVSEEQSDVLAVQAERCRRLASAISDRYTTDILLSMAEGYERNAKALRSHAMAD
jgi:PAS domain-containing protein